VADPKRSSGAFAIARTQIASNAEGTSAQCWRGGAGCSSRTFRRTS
jgi:hypothetical protein